MTESYLEWRDDYLIGIEELDFEHKDRYRRLNELHRAIASEIGTARIDDDLDAIELCLEAHDRGAVLALFRELERWIIHHVVESDLELATVAAVAAC